MTVYDQDIFETHYRRNTATEVFDKLIDFYTEIANGEKVIIEIIQGPKQGSFLELTDDSCFYLKFYDSRFNTYENISATYANKTEFRILCQQLELNRNSYFRIQTYLSLSAKSTGKNSFNLNKLKFKLHTHYKGELIYKNDKDYAKKKFDNWSTVDRFDAEIKIGDPVVLGYGYGNGSAGIILGTLKGFTTRGVPIIKDSRTGKDCEVTRSDKEGMVKLSNDLLKKLMVSYLSK